MDRLLRDYRPMTFPNTLTATIRAHQGGAKCVSLLAPDGSTAVSGGGDSVVKILDTTNGSTIHSLTGHTSRIWDVDADSTGDLVASASGDGTVRLWSSSGDHLSTLAGQGGDVYGVRFRPSTSASLGSDSGASCTSSRQVTTASYDRILRTFDIETSSLIRTFSGHSLAALCVAYDPVGTLMASGAKDRQVRLWDAVGGVCVNTMSGCLGEVTSVEFDAHGRYLLVGSKDNANRLWDLRMVRLALHSFAGRQCEDRLYRALSKADGQQRILYRYTGHQNTTKNFIRCSFALDSSMVIGGSEDGNIYAWTREPTTAAESTVSATTIIPSNGPAGAATQQARPQPNTAGGSISVSPTAVLEADGQSDHGAAFDVRERAGVMVCAWNDGHVGVWEGVDR